MKIGTEDPVILDKRSESPKLLIRVTRKLNFGQEARQRVSSVLGVLMSCWSSGIFDWLGHLLK
jgi:hypothetical protein